MAWIESLWNVSKDRCCSENMTFLQCMRNKRSTDEKEFYEDFFGGVLRWNTACSVGTLETHSGTQWRNSGVLQLSAVKHTSTGPTETPLQTCWQILFLFMSFCFLGHTVYLFHIFIYFENIFLQVWDKMKIKIQNKPWEIFLIYCVVIVWTAVFHSHSLNEEVNSDFVFTVLNCKMALHHMGQ